MKRTALGFLFALLGALALGGAIPERSWAASPMPTPLALPSFGPASVPTSLPYPAYGTPVPGVRNAATAPGVPQTVTLAQAIRIAFARSPLLATARADVALAKAGVRLQQAGLLPLVAGTASNQRIIGKAASYVTGGTFGTDITSNSLSVSLQQLVFDGGKILAEVHAARHSESAQVDTYQRTVQTVAYNVAQAYYNSLAAQRTTAVDVEVVREDSVQRDLVAAQARAGTAARSDIATADLPVAQARLALVQAQGAELSAQAAFANAMGLDADVNVLPVDDTPIFTRAAIDNTPVPPYARAIARAQALRPDYDAAEQTVASYRSSVSAAERGYFPTIMGTASTGTFSTNLQGGNFRPSTTLGLQLSLPIFDQGLTQADIAQARANLASAQAELLTEQESIQLNVKQALANYVSARAAVDQANAEYAEALTVLQATRAQYQAGVTTLPLLLNAEVGMTTALTSQVQTVYALRQAEQAFLYAEGDNDRVMLDAPVLIDDPVNAAILAVSEDRIAGFSRDPIGEIAERSGIAVETVLERIQAMLRAGVVRRVRQTMLSTSLAHGALIAWQVPEERLAAAFDYLFQEDPFSGHVVLRTADAATAGARYRLWTTLKVPQGFSLDKHLAWLAERIGAQAVRAMPAKKLFVLGVGHVRRRGLEPGSRSSEPAQALEASIVELSEGEWRVLTALKREFAPEELVRDLWVARAREAEVSLDAFYAVAEALERRGLVGRFSTFLEHVKPTVGNQRVTRYNALFHWQVPPGRELDAGREVGRHDVMTHAYWREGGPEFRNVNIMGVAHGLDKDLVLAHKAAIDEHLREAGIEIAYTNVFWGGRSEIKPSEISPLEYERFCRRNGIDPQTMRA